MLNSQKLEEVRRDLKVGDVITHVQIQGVVENTERKDTLNSIEKTINANFIAADRTDLEVSLNYLETHVSFYESVLEEMAQLKHKGEMLLEAKFKVYGISNITKKLGENLKNAGYKKFINDEFIAKTISYNICKSGNDITISFFDNSVVFSIKRSLDKIQDFSDNFIEAKESMISLYNQSIKKIKE